MNKIIMTLMAVVITTLTGCKSIPTVTEMNNLGFVSGYTAAYVLNNQVKVDDETRNTIIDIVNLVEPYLPGTNETFASTWTPIAQEYVDKLVAEDKITKTVAERVMKDFGYVITLLDQYIDNKGIRQYQDLVNAFIHSFCRSFLTNFKPSNTVSASYLELDDFTYDLIMKEAGLK